jgi:glycosyltransferase involved in cell wall biosynthesis
VDLWNPSVIGPLKEVLRRIRPDVVNTHNIDGLSPVVWQVARRHGAAVVHTLHDYHLICPRAVMQRRDGTLCNGLCATCRIYAAYHTRFQDCLDTFIAPSKAIGDVHRSAGWHVPTVVVPNGVDLPEASIPERAPNSPLQVVFMSRLVVEKGCDMMLKTIESFRDCRDIHFHVAGKGAYENRFHTLADSVPNLTWHGYITGSAKTALGAGDVFLQLSECPECAVSYAGGQTVWALFDWDEDRGIRNHQLPRRTVRRGDAATLRSMLLGHISKRALLRAQRLSRIACNRGYDVRAMARQYLNVFYSARDEVSNPVKRRAGS